MILGRILASKSSTDEDDDEDDHEVGSSFIQKGTMLRQKWRILRSKNGWILRFKNGSKMNGFGIQKWSKNGWIWEVLNFRFWRDVLGNSTGFETCLACERKARSQTRIFGASGMQSQTLS